MNAEFLPDEINMINEDGDIVPRESESEVPELDTDDPVETYRSPNFYVVEDIIKSGIEQSQSGGYRTIKVKASERMKPLGQFMAIDLYKYGLSADEVTELLNAYLPASVETEQSKTEVRRSLGSYASSGAGGQRYFDPRERASGLHKEFDD